MLSLFTTFFSRFGIADVEFIRRFFEQPVGTCQPLVVEDQQPTVFEVRCCHAPTALQVTIQVVVHNLPKGVYASVNGEFITQDRFYEVLFSNATPADIGIAFERVIRESSH
jgi:hypothetical protein